MVSLCPPCPVVDCKTDDPYKVYSLQSDVYPFVTNCPPGEVCNTPFCGSVWLVCCDGTVIERTVPCGSTVEFIHAIESGMLAECALRGDCNCTGAECSCFLPDCITTLYWNKRICSTAYCPDGTPFIYCLPAGRVMAFSQEEADRTATLIAASEARRLKLCLGKITNLTCAGEAYSARIRAVGLPLATPPGTNYWEITAGAVPTGMTFHGGLLTGNSVLIDGTPTVGGAYTFTVKITTPSGAYMSKPYTINVVQILPATLPAIEIGTPYSTTFTALGVPTGAIAEFYLASGTLPDGLSLADSGLLDGTPTEDGTFQILIAVHVIT